MTREALLGMISGGQVRSDTLVWREGLVNWTPAADVHELAGSDGSGGGSIFGSSGAAPATVPGPIMTGSTSPNSDGMAIASMIIGIVSLCLGLCAPYITVVPTIVGLILGVKSKTRGGIRTSGIILNSVALGISVIFVGFMIIMMVLGP